MIDVHAHFAEEGYSFPEEWERILSAGVERVILASDTLAHSRAHASFCREFSGAYFAAGVHPSELEGFDQEALFAIEALASEEKCVAIGEIGLDYHYGGEDKRAQREAFLSQLALAEKLKLPVQIHSRDACADTLAILKEHEALLKTGFLMHCYSYGAENLDAFLRLGAFFSFGGVVCFKNARRAVESAEICPLERMLTETDSPYLSPVRGEKNTPANIPIIADKLAEIKQISREKLIEAVEENARRLFPKLR